MIEEVFDKLKKVWKGNQKLLGRGCFCVKMYAPDSRDWDESSSSDSISSRSSSMSSGESSVPNLGCAEVPGQRFYVNPDSKTMIMHINVVIPGGTVDEKKALADSMRNDIAKALEVPRAKVVPYNMFGSWKAGVVMDPQVFYHIAMPSTRWNKPQTLLDHNMSSVDRLWFLDQSWKDEAETHEMEWTLNKI